MGFHCLRSKIGYQHASCFGELFTDLGVGIIWRDYTCYRIAWSDMYVDDGGGQIHHQLTFGSQFAFLKIIVYFHDRARGIHSGAIEVCIRLGEGIQGIHKGRRQECGQMGL